jgi:PAS domain S-box-containing protein
MDERPDADELLLATDLHVEARSRLMEALVESENRMRRRVELLADAVIETDSNRALVFLNPAWESLRGWPAQQCLGRAASDFFPEDCRADVEQVLSDRTGQHQELATRLEHADGRTVHVVLTTSSSPMPSASSTG